MNAANCPAHELLARFALGDLSAAEFARIAEHLEQCRTCAAVLQTLDDHTDPLLTSLRKTREVECGEVPGALLAAARSALARNYLDESVSSNSSRNSEVGRSAPFFE